MFKFTLIVNENQKDGFKLSFKTETDEELRIAEKLSEQLISKISKIEVRVTNPYTES